LGACGSLAGVVCLAGCLVVCGRVIGHCWGLEEVGSG
jgi:hypothetical protein